MKRRYDLYLKDILKAIEKIKKYVGSKTLDEFVKDDKTQDAVMRNLHIIGEASSQLQDWVKREYQEVPWQKIKDFRNVAVHKYDKIDLDIVWEIIQNKVDELKKQVEKILEEETESNSEDS